MRIAAQLQCVLTRYAVGACVLVLALAGCPSGAPAPLPLPNAPAPRTVTPSAAVAELIVAIGAEPHLVGVSPYCTHPPQLVKLPKIGGLQPNLEQLEVLRPDLLLWQGNSELAAAYAKRREVPFESFRVETFADIEGTLIRLGEVFARPEAAQAEVERLRAAVLAAGAGAPAKRPRVLMVFGREPGQLRQIPAVGSGTFLSECLEACGGENALGTREGWPTLGPEGLLELKPDVVLELVSDADPQPDALAARVADWERYTEIPAVGAGRVHTVVGTELLIPGPRLSDVLTKFKAAVHR